MVQKEPYQVLEEAYAEFCGSDYAVSCNSGTSALHLALLALGIKKGDEVIVPDFTMAAVAFAVSYTGAAPVFADVDLSTYFILPSEVKRLRTEKTKAIIAVHTYGRVGCIQTIVDAAGGLPVVEDACEAQGAVYKSRATLTCYSFYKNKIIHAEEGGMVTTDKPELAKKVRYLKNMSFSPQHDYYHEAIGYNYRMANSQAKMAYKSLCWFYRNNGARKIVEGWYDMLISPYLPKRDAVWFYDMIGDQTAVNRIPEARLPFQPLSTFPMYGGKRGQGRPNAQWLANNLLLLPVTPQMTITDVRRIYSFL